MPGLLNVPALLSFEALGSTLSRVGRLPWNSNGRVLASSQGAYSR